MVQLSIDQAIALRWAEAGFRKGLIVDDSRASRLLVERTMGSMGLTTHYAENGWEAYTTLESEQVDVVVTDIEMPFWSGLDLLRAIRKSPRRILQEIPVVVVSSVRDRRVIAEVRQFTSAYFLPKPIDVQQLQLTLGMIATSRWLRNGTVPLH